MSTEAGAVLSTEFPVGDETEVLPSKVDSFNSGGDPAVSWVAGLGMVVGVVAGGASRGNGLAGILARGTRFLCADRVRDVIPGGSISIGGFFPASAKLVSLGSSREARKAAAASVLTAAGELSSSFCSILFQT